MIILVGVYGPDSGFVGVVGEDGVGVFLLAYLCPDAKKAHIVPGVIVGVASLILIALQTQLSLWMGISQFVHINLSIEISSLLIFIIGFIFINLSSHKKTKA